MSRNIYSHHTDAVSHEAEAEAQDSMKRARHEHYGVSSSEEVLNILVSCNGTWQKRRFSSLFGAVFIIVYETGKVVDYCILAKHCAGCKQWEEQDKTTWEYAEWKENHICTINFSASAGVMESIGTL